jgi:hypothetical protein
MILALNLRRSLRSKARSAILAILNLLRLKPPIRLNR